MEVSVCFHQATRRVAFVEAPPQFLELLQELSHCTPLDLGCLLGDDKLSTSQKIDPFRRLSLTGDKEARLRRVRESHPKLVNILQQYLGKEDRETDGSRSKETLKAREDPEYRVCGAHFCPSSMRQYVFRADAQMQCPICAMTSAENNDTSANTALPTTNIPPPTNTHTAAPLFQPNVLAASHVFNNYYQTPTTSAPGVPCGAAPSPFSFAPSPVVSATLPSGPALTPSGYASSFGSVFQSPSAVRPPSCTPIPVSFIPSRLSQTRLDTDVPLFRCTTPSCPTFSNARLAPCSTCKKGVMALNAAVITKEGLVATGQNWRTSISTLPGNAHVMKVREGVLLLAPKKYLHNGPEGVTSEQPLSLYGVEVSKAVYACDACLRFVSNTFNATCTQCRAVTQCLFGSSTRQAGKARRLCTVVTPKNGSAHEVEWHPWASSGTTIDECSNQASDPLGSSLTEELTVISDTLQVYPRHSFIQKLKLLKDTGIFQLQDMSEATVRIGKKEVTALCKLGHHDDCSAIFTEAFEAYLM